MSFRRRIAAFALVPLSITVACSDPPTSSTVPDRPDHIIGGQPTGNLYSNVGALLFDFAEPIGVVDGNDLLCTGSLISPTVFLTAAHCVSNVLTPPGSQFYVTFTPDLLAPFSVITATGYDYDPLRWTNQSDLHDVAVVLLPASATTNITPLNLPRAGELDQLAAHGGLTDRSFINVGYGVDASRVGRPSYTWDGKRRQSTSEFMSLTQASLNLLMNAAALDSANTANGGDCSGDSGGPKFLVGGDPTVTYGILSKGDLNCRATSWSYRVDTPDARAFLSRYVTLP